MIGTLRKLGRAAKSFWRREDGNGTIEFILVLPAFFVLFTSAYEGGMLSTRHVMLERGLDQTVRLVRIGAIPNVNHEVLVDKVCQYASIIPDCKSNLRLEMLKRDPFSWTDIPEIATCVDRRENDAKPVLGYNAAGSNELLILRACALFDPMIPTSGLGKALPQKAGGGYGLVATSSFVVEPS